jgi:hypothetical protein
MAAFSSWFEASRPLHSGSRRHRNTVLRLQQQTEASAAVRGRQGWAWRLEGAAEGAGEGWLRPRVAGMGWRPAQGGSRELSGRLAGAVEGAGTGRPRPRTVGMGRRSVQGGSREPSRVMCKGASRRAVAVRGRKGGRAIHRAWTADSWHGPAVGAGRLTGAVRGDARGRVAMGVDGAQSRGRTCETPGPGKEGARSRGRPAQGTSPTHPRLTGAVGAAHGGCRRGRHGSASTADSWHGPTVSAGRLTGAVGSDARGRVATGIAWGNGALTVRGRKGGHAVHRARGMKERGRMGGRRRNLTHPPNKGDY